MSAVHVIGDIVELPQPLKRLPVASRGFVHDILLERDQAAAVARSVTDQIVQYESKRMELAERRHKLMQAGLTDADPQIINLDAEIAQCLDVEERMGPRAALHSMTVSNDDLLVRNLVKYIQPIKSDVRLGKPFALPKLSKGESYEDAIETRRRRGRELAANKDKVRAAPHPSSDAKESAKKVIEQHASRGAPDAYYAIERGEPVKWPIVRFSELYAMVGRIEIETPDTMAILCHLFKDQMIAAANAAIDAAADDGSALGLADRARLIDEAERDALAVQREEVALIKAARAAGRPLLFRPDVDPRALLELADDMPAPR